MIKQNQLKYYLSLVWWTHFDGLYCRVRSYVWQTELFPFRENYLTKKEVKQWKKGRERERRCEIERKDEREGRNYCNNNLTSMSIEENWKVLRTFLKNISGDKIVTNEVDTHCEKKFFFITTSSFLNLFCICIKIKLL